MQKVDITEGGRVLDIRWQAGHCSRFHSVWLRDNAADSETRAENGQRLLTLQDIAADIRMAGVAVIGDSVEVTFDGSQQKYLFDKHWLLQNSYDKPVETGVGWLEPGRQVFDSSLALPEVTANWVELHHDRAVLQHWLQKFRLFGFARVVDGPTTERAVLELARLIGYVRQTNYGKLFEVRSKPDPENLAYSNLGLEAHTDNPYRDPVPGAQLLYCLANSADGGDSQVIDGFNVALQLREQDPSGFELLHRYCARFEYTGAGDVHLNARRPIIELLPDGQLQCIRFNNRSAAAFTDIPFDDMPAYYQAYRQMGELINQPQNAVEFKLNPGECFIVDNTRVLHARRAFTNNGERWLQGCYVDLDGIYSTLSVLKKSGKE